MRTLLPLLLSLMAIPLLPTITLADPPPLTWGSSPNRIMAQPLTDQTDQDAYVQYQTVIEQTQGMVIDSEAQALAQRFGLTIVDLTWEDTGRYKGSSVGPNISDMTIQVQNLDLTTGRSQPNLMPVIRYPNFSDKTADVDLDQFYLLVGNETGQPLRHVSLREYLDQFRNYLHDPASWTSREGSLLAKRDTHVLVSAQAAFLPIPSGGTAEFNPVLFNYQSYPGDPAVLAILATREGTSATVIDNQRDGFESGSSWGQRLFFNKDGQRASLTGQRATDFIADQTTNPDTQPFPAPQTEAEVEQQGLNMVMLIQVPLKQKQPRRQTNLFSGNAMLMEMAAAPVSEARSSNVEAAVIGHGQVEGPFTEIANLPIERDPNFPIRVTVQFYKATSNGIVSSADLQQIHSQITRIYEDADYVGSLVVEGETNRPTEYEGSKEVPPNWWPQWFWRQGSEEDPGS